MLRRGVTQASLAASVNAHLQSLLGHAKACECVFLDCVFLDNTLHMLSNAELVELHSCPHCGEPSGELEPKTFDYPPPSPPT